MPQLIDEKFEPEAIVIANGDFPAARQARRWLHTPGAYMACCDGAAGAYIRNVGRKPDAIVGDGDSIAPGTATECADIMHRVAEQETNDLSKNIRFLKSKHFRNIVILGATGKREDHTLGNVSLLVDYLKEGLNVRMVSDYGTFIPCRDNVTINCRKGQAVSIFSFGATGLQSENLKYPLHNLSNWWQGTLNTATGTCFSVFAQGYYIVYLAH